MSLLGPGPFGTPGPQNQLGVNPMFNNMPLEFNKNKGKPPMATPIPRDDSEQDKSRGREEELNYNRQLNGQPDAMSGGYGNVAMNQMMNQWGPVMGPLLADPSMMMQYQYGNWNNTNVQQTSYTKEIVHFKTCVLYPPPANAPPTTTRERPNGCRTVFVGGLPELIREDIIQEVFDTCGYICSIRLSKKSFAHIRFQGEECVERALYFSGYRMKIDNKDDKANTGRLHVDYAQARDDQYEWECQQRALMREMRHRQRIEEEMLRPPSPPPISHYSDHEASRMLEDLKSDESFACASTLLVTWMERGDCSHRNSNTFYTMIQSVNAHVRRLVSEKAQHDEQLELMKLQFKQQLENILRQFDQIEKVFNAASLQKVWDHFTKAQRKNVDLWKKQCQEIKQTQLEEIFSSREETEMDLETTEESVQPAPKRRKEDFSSLSASNNNALQEENDTLKCQMEAYKNEIDMVKSEGKNLVDLKDKQIQALQQALHGTQQQLMATKKQMQDALEVKVRSMEYTDNKLKTTTENKELPSSPNDWEARLISLISTFLLVHPFGATVDYIWSYLQHLDVKIRSSEIEALLERFPSVFQLDLCGVGVSFEKRWRFVAHSNATGSFTLANKAFANVTFEPTSFKPSFLLPNLPSEEKTKSDEKVIIAVSDSHSSEASSEPEAPANNESDASVSKESD